MTNTNLNDEWVLITGATSGIGLAFAEELAAEKKNIILASRSQAKLEETALKLRQKHGSNVHVVAADLGTKEGILTLFTKTTDMHVDFLINNVGREESGHFLDLDIDEMVGSIALNCTAPLMLSHHYGKKMKSRGRGEILFLSSIVAFQGVPLISNYAATKSYNLILAEGLAAELSSHGIKVSVVTPGFTETNLSPEISFAKVPMKPASPTGVARSSLKARHNKQLYIPGFINKVLFFLGKFVQSRQASTNAFGKVFKKVLAEKLAKPTG